MAWLAAGVTASLRRPRTALALLVVALVVTAARVVPVMLLAARGWWFVQEKVLLGLPLLTLAALAAAAIAGPPGCSRRPGLRDGARVPGRVSRKRLRTRL
ncbi:hypothetical protein ACFSTC_02930 [Nonomuraea ferruginea]